MLSRLLKKVGLMVYTYRPLLPFISLLPEERIKEEGGDPSSSSSSFNPLYVRPLSFSPQLFRSVLAPVGKSHRLRWRKKIKRERGGGGEKEIFSWL